MQHSIKYGKTSLDLSLPDKIRELKVKEPDGNVNAIKFCADLQKQLPDYSGLYTNVGIVVADKTRLCDYPAFLHVLVNTLLERGATSEGITFYIAYGTHKQQSDEESLRCYGKVFKQYSFIHHNAGDENALTAIGTTQHGTPVKVRKDILECSLLITFGAISHHYFAGFGGGRKLIFPGLAGKEAVFHNHGLFLDRKHKTLSKGCQPGNLTNNPIAEDLKEIDSLLPPKISIHGILNSKGQVADLMVGKSYTDFESACEVHNSYYLSQEPEQFDLVLASSGGAPKDINFIQAHKSLHHATAFVKDGGRLILLSECPDGIGSNTFLKYFEFENFEKAFGTLANNYEGNGGTALSLMLKTKRISIHMVTELDEDLCKQIGIAKTSFQEAKKIILDEPGTMALIENASLLVRK